MLRCVLIVPILFLAGCGAHWDPVIEGPFQTPPGFVVEQVAGDDAVGSLIQLTFDAEGRLVVSKERGYPTRLLDNDGDGVYETQQTISDQVENCQGIWFDGPVLYADCSHPDDGEAYLFKLTDRDGDGKADEHETVVRYLGRIGEHGPHDIRRGPDGIPTVMLGNHTFIPAERIAAASPLKNYGEGQLLKRYMDARGHAVGRLAPGGALFRINDGGESFSLLFGGLRNSYNHAYNYEGEVFTFDSDMEWDISLPWYREVRSVHGAPSGDYGWRTGSGKFPPYYLDSLPPVDDLGRGSPVGVDFYHSYAYPAAYFDGFLQGDWSRGRVVLSKFRRAGATYEPAEPTTDFIYGEPLNVTDLEVGPDGLVYFTMGGRGTQGGVFRAAYKGYESNRARRPDSGILSVVRQPQPLSAFSHAWFLETQTTMGDAWGAELTALVRDEQAEASDRMQALHLLQRYGPKPNAELIRAAYASPDARLRAAAIYVVGQHGSDRAKAIAAGGLQDADSFVRRRAAEALLRMGAVGFAATADLYRLLTDDDRFVRWAGRSTLEETDRGDWKGRVVEEQNVMAAATGMLGLVRTAAKPIEIEAVFEKSLSMLKRPGLSAEDELALLRVFHLACIEIEGGCRQSLRNQIYETVAPRFPAGDERLNREYSRTMAYSGRPEAIEKILSRIPSGDENRQLQIHYIYCLREIPAGWSAEQKKTLIEWFQKARNWRGGASFPGFINRMFESSLAFFSEEEKQAAYAAIPEYAPVDDEKLLEQLRRREDHVQPNVFARKRGTQAYGKQEIFEYMMYDPMTTIAKVETGVEIFNDACAKCHKYGSLGKDYGPDLTTVANRFSRRDMLEAVLYPSKTISDQYGSWRIETADDIYSAMILDEDDEKITVLLPDLDRPVEIVRSKIVDLRESDVSIMPEDLLDAYDMRSAAGLFRLLEEGPPERGR